MSLRVLDTSYELVRSLRDVVRRLSRVDGDLARQVRRAASSVSLNLAEGSGRAGRDRLHCYRIARGSALEVRASLRLAVAWGDLREAEVERSLSIVDDVLAMLGGLLR